MKYAIVSGSHRSNSQSAKVARFIGKILEREAPSSEQFFLDLGNHPLPIWDEGKWAGEQRWREAWGPISEQLKQADALIAISPEWAGMVPPQLKNFFLLCDQGELAHKPGLIVAVSSSRGGAYPIAELRMSSYKNCFLNWIPDHVIVRNVETVLNQPFQADSKDDQYTQDRLLYSIKILQAYAQALSHVRASGIIDLSKYPFGM